MSETKNGWENIGWFIQKAIDEHSLDAYELKVYAYIVRYSVGYRDALTNAMTQPDWAKKIGISRPTFTKAIRSLEEKGLVKKSKHIGFIDGGGSAPMKYGPVFPDPEDHFIKLKSNEKEKQQKEEATEVKPMTQEELKAQAEELFK